MYNKIQAQKTNFEDDMWLILDFLNSLVNNGQVVDCDNNLAIDADIVFCHVTIPEEAALLDNNNEQAV